MLRRIPRVVVASGLSLLLPAGLLRSEAPAAGGFLPVSVWYSGGKARAPMLSTITPRSREEWGLDLDQIKTLGFNTVRTWVEWAHAEPRRGEYRFENLELLCELADQRGLRVIVQVYADSAPDWVGRDFPDALFEAQSGEKVPSQSAPGYCTDHAGVRQAMLEFYTQAARVAGRYPNLFAWDLWSEPHILNWAVIEYVPNAQFCFCPHTRARFREWLKGRYGELSALNRAWYRGFDSWEQVDPPRFGTILSYTDFIDWKTFIYDKLAGDLRMRYEAVRRNDPVHVITSHAAVPSLFTSPFNGDGASDDYLMARQVDYYGTSIYPKHSRPQTHWPAWQVAAAMEFARCVNLPNGGFYVGELQAGPGARGVVIGDPITGEDHRLWLWSAVARGAKAVNFYAYYPMSSGYESNGYGLIELDGRPTERAVSTGRQARLIHEHRELLLASRPLPARIAVVYNPLAQMVGGEQNSGPPGALRDSLIGYWRALWEANVPVDFIHRRQVEAGELSGYRLLIVPYPVMWTQKAADGLREFVRKGGCAVAEARLAWNDERGYAAEAIPGMGLAEVFGARETQVRMVDRVEVEVDLGSLPDGGDESRPSSWRLQGAYLEESFIPPPGDSISRGERPTPRNAVVNRFGEGRTLLLGTFLGLATHQTQAPANRQFIRALAAWAGVTPPVRVRGVDPGGEPVEVVLRTAPDGYLLFVLNHGREPRKVETEVAVSDAGEYRVSSLLYDGRLTVPARDGMIRLPCALSGRGVEVLHVRRSAEASP
ncbi:MAG: hypothetical protein AMXMBFR83_30390 [Phycisphaerae bacterium]